MVDKYQTMMTQFLAETQPDMFQATDDPDVWQAVVSPQKVKGFQNYINRLRMQDEEVHKAAEAGEAWKNELKRWMGASSELQKNMKILKNEDEQKMEELAFEREVISKGMLTHQRTNLRPEQKENQTMDVAPSEKPGWMMAEGSNFWSVNEKDPYWQTPQGYEEAMNLYGFKPGWIQEPVEDENIVDLQPTRRISL